MNWGVIGVMRQGRMRVGIFVAVALLHAGCYFYRTGYEKVEDSPTYIGEDYLATVVAEGRTQDEVIANLGLPDERDEEARAIGYKKCIESEGRELFFIFVPYPVPVSWPKMEIANCQFVVIWFNEQGRAARKSTSSQTYSLQDEGEAMDYAGDELKRIMHSPAT